MIISNNMCYNDREVLSLKGSWTSFLLQEGVLDVQGVQSSHVETIVRLQRQTI